MENAKYISLALGFVAGALSYWFQSPEEWTAFGVSIYVIMTVTSLLFSLFATYRYELKKQKAIAFIVSGMILAVGVRVIWDTTFGLASHNLFPFEMLIVSFWGVIGSFIGAFIGEYSLRFIKTPK